VSARPVIFDCDPGKDDAFALFLALACPDMLNVLAITTVGGNVPVGHTTANAHRILAAASRTNIPVFSGCARPMLRRLETAEATHGMDGLGGSGLPQATIAPRSEHAVAALIRILEEQPEPLTLVAIGPLTNLAVLMIARPDLAEKIEHLVVMGGAQGRGNMTEHAEFNIHVDPHAASVALSVSAPISLVTLDTTRNLRPPLAWFEAMAHANVPTRALAGMWREAPVALYDVAATALLLWPDLFDLQPCTIEVITEGARSGKTVIEVGKGKDRLLTHIDEKRLLERIDMTLTEEDIF
jgi:inosine-uridine nucleoside N-ribohydrolase